MKFRTKFGTHTPQNMYFTNVKIDQCWKAILQNRESVTRQSFLGRFSRYPVMYPSLWNAFEDRVHIRVHVYVIWKVVPVMTRVVCHIRYSDVIMSAMASKSTGASIVYPIVCSGLDQGKHQSSASLAFVRGIHRRQSNAENVPIWCRHHVIEILYVSLNPLRPSDAYMRQ